MGSFQFTEQQAGEQNQSKNSYTCQRGANMTSYTPQRSLPGCSCTPLFSIHFRSLFNLRWAELYLRAETSGKINERTTNYAGCVCRPYPYSCTWVQSWSVWQWFSSQQFISIAFAVDTPMYLCHNNIISVSYTVAASSVDGNSPQLCSFSLQEHLQYCNWSFAWLYMYESETKCMHSRRVGMSQPSCTNGMRFLFIYIIF